MSLSNQSKGIKEITIDGKTVKSITRNSDQKILYEKSRIYYVNTGETDQTSDFDIENRIPRKQNTTPCRVSITHSNKEYTFQSYNGIEYASFVPIIPLSNISFDFKVSGDFKYNSNKPLGLGLCVNRSRIFIILCNGAYWDYLLYNGTGAGSNHYFENTHEYCKLELVKQGGNVYLNIYDGDLLIAQRSVTIRNTDSVIVGLLDEQGGTNVFKNIMCEII